MPSSPPPASTAPWAASSLEAKHREGVAAHCNASGATTMDAKPEQPTLPCRPDAEGGRIPAGHEKGRNVLRPYSSLIVGC